MNTKVDKQIKNYLKKISFEIKKSKSNNTIHYKACIGDSEVHIRFSDHFSNRTKKVNLDIIKIQDTIYTIRCNNLLSTTITSNDVLGYVKSLTLIYCDLNKFLDKLSDIQTKYEKLLKKYNKDTLILEIETLTKENESIREKYEKVFKEMLSYKQNSESLKKKINAIKGILK